MSENTQAILRYELYDACDEFKEAYETSDNKNIEGHLFGLLNATNEANDKLGEDKFMKIDEYLARYLALAEPSPDQPDFTQFSEASVKNMSLGDKWTSFRQSCRAYQDAVDLSEEVEASEEAQQILKEERDKASLVRSVWHTTLPETVRLLVPYKITKDTLSWFDAFPETPPSRDDLNVFKTEEAFSDAFTDVVSLVTSYLPDASLEDITKVKAQLQEIAPEAAEGLDEVLRSWDVAKRKSEWAVWVSAQAAMDYLEPSTS
ncbi:hypothetical protein JCM24511_03609 [Saitozyma sp. JCM 24511]|nr:hypothetical protein JCM24511_03609 [Saitozyma sp. JCM 24511]